MKNHYQTLGLNRNATNQEIKKAYRKLVQKFHPDKNNGDKFFEDRFREVQEAYEILSDSYKKRKYDINYDFFFSGKQNNNKEYTNRESPKYQEPKPEPENRDKRENERVKKDRVANIKKNVALQFEDKAWIFLGNWFIIPGAVGLWMFFKYRSEGYIKKSNTVCSLTIISFVMLFILAIIMLMAQTAGRSNY